MMIAHVTLPVRSYEKARAFYGKVLMTLGYSIKMDSSEWKAVGYNDGKNTDFWITEKESAQPVHVAFEAKNRDEVEAFYNTALAEGAKDNGAPGYRKEYWPGYYAAFVHDADGHNIECVWYDYEAT